MAMQKFEHLRLGPGNIQQRDGECELFVSKSEPRNGSIVGLTPYASGNSYSIGNVVSYKTQYYASLTNLNTGNAPDVSPSQWSLINGKDGDVWIKVPNVADYRLGGSDVEMYVKNNGNWVSVTNANPFTVILNDNQVAAAIAISYPAVLLPFATVQYTLRRDTIPAALPSYAQIQEGTMTVISDGATANFTHDYSANGIDMGVDFSVDVVAGVVRISYTSTSQSKQIEFRYILKGWNASPLTIV